MATRSAARGAGELVPSGLELLQDPVHNKGTAFPEEEREQFGLRGLLPPRVQTMEEQVRRVLANFHAQPDDLAKYIYLAALHDRNETLYYRIVMDAPEEMMPIIYTPTVGQACQQYGQIFQRPRGLFISSKDRGRILHVLRNWPRTDVGMIVVTDGERILGLGDLGANGMGIPVGKLALYTACAGVDPRLALPVTLDVGTENPDLLRDSLYIGLRQHRIRGPEYDALLEEFVRAVEQVFPSAVLQFEDFATQNAFKLLRRYRDQLCCFNDDIQGTAGVALAGMLSALRVTRTRLTEQRLLCVGAGEAATGISDLVCAGMVAEGLGALQARERCLLFDSQGLVVRSRSGLAEHKQPFAHDLPFESDLATVIERYRPTVLLGASGQPGLFTRKVLEAMARVNDRPVVFALSNPTSKSECSAEQAYQWTGGRALFASGSPFAPVQFEGRTFVPGQGNNAYIFPGVGLGLIASRARRCTDEMFTVAAHALAAQVTEEDLKLGRLYPSLTRIQEVSLQIAAAVARLAWERGLAAGPRPPALEEHLAAMRYRPVYRSYLATP